MAQLVSLSPNDHSENQSYLRHVNAHLVRGLMTLVVHANTTGGNPVPLTGSLRWLLDGSPITGWVTGTGAWTADFDWGTISDGSHWLDWEVLGGGHISEGLAVTVDNQPGPITGPQRIWTGANNYDLRNGVSSPGAHSVLYTPGAGPRPDPLVPRSGTPVSVRLTRAQTWVERMAISVTKGSPRRFHDHPGGHIGIWPRQVYHSTDAPYDYVPGFMDGPRNMGQLGYAWHGVCDRRDNSFVATIIGGRIARVGLDGAITTKIGKRLKAGRPMPYFGGPNDPDWWAHHGAWHVEHFETVGRFVDGPAGLRKPWGTFQCPLHDEDWYTLDTGNHRVVYWEDEDDPLVTTYAGSRSAQAGYRDGPRGEALFNQPWQGDMRTVEPDAPEGFTCDLYLTDKWNHAIRVITAAGPVTTLARSRPDMRPTPAELALGSNDDGIPGLPIETIRSRYLKDGDFDDCSCVTPEAFTWANVERTAFLVVERATLALRRWDLEARTVTTLRLLTRDENTRNPAMTCDVLGVYGPVGDIFVTTWGDHTYRFTKDGGWVPSPFLTEVPGHWLNGPMDQYFHPPYPAAIAIGGDGALWWTYIGAEGCGRATARRATDPAVGVAAYGQGESFWRYGSRPSLLVMRGEGCQDQTGGPVAADLAGLDDTGLRAALGVPITDAQLVGVREYLRVWAFGSVPVDAAVHRSARSFTVTA